MKHTPECTSFEICYNLKLFFNRHKCISYNYESLKKIK